jgi:CDP-diglyceride synthetase
MLITKQKAVKAFETVSDLIYTVVSLSMLAISLLMIGYGLWEVWHAFSVSGDIIKKMLDAIGLIVISMAVFDVAKYFLEEEVLRDRELRSAREARETLTKFLVIITIAVSLEALVFIFGAGKENVSLLFYPTLLLVAVVLLIVGLGLYQRLSMTTERQATVSANITTAD